MNILLLGKGGQVGWELQRALLPLGRVLACDFDSPEPWRADFSQPTTLPGLIERVQPDLIVNAAAYTAVDKAESEPERARAINATAPGVLARCAAARGVPLVHYSTDYVFDGSGSHARGEDEATGPLNVYGSTKLEGEETIRASGCQHLILRTSWVYAARGGNFARTMLRLAAEHSTLRVISDQVGAPTSAEWLADVTAHAVCRLQADARLGGTYHCAAAGFTSWHGYAQHVIGYAHHLGQANTPAFGPTLKATAEAVHAISTREYPTPAQRPLNSRLNCSKLQHTFGLHIPPWQLGVERMLTEVLAA
jgi:dTDP-4-dehydrorhamnose reductase